MGRSKHVTTHLLTKANAVRVDGPFTDPIAIWDMESREQLNSIGQKNPRAHASGQAI